MLILATGNLFAEVEGDRIIFTVPSGKDKLQIALTLNQALMGQASLKSATSMAYISDFAAPTAEVVKFATLRRKSTRAR